MRTSHISSSGRAFWPCLLLAAALWPLSALLAQQPASKETGSTASQAEQPDSGSNAPGSDTQSEHVTGIKHDVLFSFGHDVELKAGDTADAVVVIFGSAKVRGNVHEAVVSVWGDVDIDASAQDVVAVMGNLRAGPNTKISGATVTVGGHQELAKGATLGDNPTEVDFPNWLKGWIRHCVLLGRPLAPQVFFVWVIALVILFLYLLIALLFPQPIQACVNELTLRPATTCIIGLLSIALLPLVIFILAATGLGLVVVPFIIAALCFAALLGRVALLEWIGFRLVGQFASNVVIKPGLALVLGALIIAVLYLIPILGLFTFFIISVWGIGGAVMAGFGGLRRELPERRTSPVPPTMAASPGAPGPVEMTGSIGGASTAPQSASAGIALPTAPPVLPEVLSYPRAGFWERMAAGFLDFVLIGLATRFSFHLFGPFAFLVAIAYFAGMWTWRGTSIGGIVLGLKVVRLDGQTVNFAVALVRALAAAFSMVVLFLGFLWITWDSEKQGWHDKIAGTVVLKLPRGTPLV